MVMTRSMRKKACVHGEREDGKCLKKAKKGRQGKKDCAHGRKKNHGGCLKEPKRSRRKYSRRKMSRKSRGCKHGRLPSGRCRQHALKSRRSRSRMSRSRRSRGCKHGRLPSGRCRPHALKSRRSRSRRSRKLSKYQEFIKAEMHGVHGTRTEVRAHFKRAASRWRKTHPRKSRASRSRRSRRVKSRGMRRSRRSRRHYKKSEYSACLGRHLKNKKHSLKVAHEMCKKELGRKSRRSAAYKSASRTASRTSRKTASRTASRTSRKTASRTASRTSRKTASMRHRPRCKFGRRADGYCRKRPRRSKLSSAAYNKATKAAPKKSEAYKSAGAKKHSVAYMLRYL